MTTAPLRLIRAPRCPECAGRDAQVLDIVSGSRLDSDRVAARIASELGADAHTHADPSSDMYVVRAMNAATTLDAAAPSNATEEATA
ncbi:hypothetical protein [Streptomyces sp. NPDC004230]